MSTVNDLLKFAKTSEIAAEQLPIVLDFITKFAIAKNWSEEEVSNAINDVGLKVEADNLADIAADNLELGS